MSDKFTALGRPGSSYVGASTISITSGNYTLNGVPMELERVYEIKDGDVIEDLDPKPLDLTPDDLKWKFRKEVEIL